MRSRYTTILILAAGFLLQSCGKGGVKSRDLELEEFSAMIKQFPAAPIIDVRTPEEFSKGALPKALNYDWNGIGFREQISSLNTSKPVFVYCLSGARSTMAAEQMRAYGFEEVYTLNGGILKWRAANLPEQKSSIHAGKGMSKQEFEALLVSDKLLLVDFYADWCAPCKKMKPYLDQISKDMSDKVQVIRINADDNQDLCRELKVDALPVLHVYQNKVLTWSNIGFIKKDLLLQHLQ